MGWQRGFLVITPPNFNGSGWNLEYKSKGPCCTLTQKMRKLPQRFWLRVTTRDLLIFSVTNAKWTFGHLSSTDFNHFRNKMWIGVHMCTSMKNCTGVFQTTKKLKMGNFKGCLSTGYSSTAQFQAMGIISRISWNPKDVPFVHEFWWGTYGLGTKRPEKPQFW